MDQRVNIVGFSVFNKTHPFFQDFVLSLNRSWQENCDHAPFTGTPVSATHTHNPTHTLESKVTHVRTMDEPCLFVFLPSTNSAYSIWALLCWILPTKYIVKYYYKSLIKTPVKYIRAFIQLTSIIAGAAVGSCCFPGSSLAAFCILLITFIMACSSLNVFRLNSKQTSGLPSQHAA